MTVQSHKKETWKLSDLKPFPDQEKVFRKLTDDAVARLAANIKRYGLKNRIVVLPAHNKLGLPGGTIIKGHERLRALLINGDTEALVIVRYDLAEASLAAIKREFLEDNLDRKQLSKLAMARAAIELLEVERQEAKKLRTGKREEARDRVGRVLNMSGRNLDRYLLVLKTPIEVQNAVEDHLLPLVTAGKVAFLPQPTQEQIAASIHSGMAPRLAVKPHLPTKRREHKKASDALANFVRKLGAAYEDLAHRIGEVPVGMISQSHDDLNKAFQLIRSLLNRTKKTD